MKLNTLHIILSLPVLLTSCTSTVSVSRYTDGYAQYFDILGESIVASAPDGGRRDTLDVSVPFSRIVCMSSTHVACLSLLGRPDAVAGVNGLKYITDDSVRANPSVCEVGDVDYERVISLRPDLLIASGEGMADYSRLESFGIKVLHLYDFMENHPLARAEYLRLFGALIGCQEKADSIFAAISASYLSLAADAASCTSRPAVLVNIPYKDAWYVPGRDSYFAQLIRDAGADVAGAREGAASSVMTVEEAFAISREAGFWLHPGWCGSLDELCAANPLFPEFHPLGEGRVYNNTLRAGEGGGNDYYESGAVRPDLVLEDLIRIFHPDLPGDKKNVSPGDLHYYIELH